MDPSRHQQLLNCCCNALCRGYYYAGSTPNLVINSGDTVNVEMVSSPLVPWQVRCMQLPRLHRHCQQMQAIKEIGCVTKHMHIVLDLIQCHRLAVHCSAHSMVEMTTIRLSEVTQESRASTIGPSLGHLYHGEAPLARVMAFMCSQVCCPRSAHQRSCARQSPATCIAACALQLALLTIEVEQAESLLPDIGLRCRSHLCVWCRAWRCASGTFPFFV